MPSYYDSPLMVFFYTRASIGPSVHSLFRSYKEKVAENVRHATSLRNIVIPEHGQSRNIFGQLLACSFLSILERNEAPARCFQRTREDDSGLAERILP